MTDTKAYLPTAYTVETTSDAHQFYDEWAASYDAEIAANGYVTPKRCAAALARCLEDKTLPVLDFGCGTGLSGLALRAEGFSTLDGCDLSANMLSEAQQKTGAYRRLWQVSEDQPFGFAPGHYAAIVAAGVLAKSHAPAETIDLAMAHLLPGGLFVFSLNDHTLTFPEFAARLSEQIDTGAARLLFKEYGEHLPGNDLKAMVYVLEKA